jgi:hypothetical protein
MNDHVSQPTAQLLKDAGWDTTTDFSYNEGLLVYETWAKTFPKWWLPAPSIGELRERLTDAELEKYFCNTTGRKWGVVWEKTDWSDFALWLCDVTASADELATIWLWVKGKEGKGVTS